MKAMKPESCSLGVVRSLDTLQGGARLGTRKRTSPLFFLLILLLSWELFSPLPVLAENQPAAVEAKITEGRKHLSKKRFEKAAAALEEADRLADGTSAEALKLLAVIYRRLDQDDQAVAATLSLFRLAPDRETSALRDVVRYYGQLGRFDEITDLLGELLEGTQNIDHQIWAHNEMGCWDVRRAEAAGQPPGEDATTALRIAHGLAQESSTVVRLNLAEALLRQGRFEDAAGLMVDLDESQPERVRDLNRLSISPMLQRPEGNHLSARTPKAEPTPLSKPMPQYTEEARKARLQGSVVFRIRVDEAGRAEILEVEQGLEMGLTEAAADAVRQWRYEPARDAAGEPMTAETTATINFRLQ